MENLLQKVVNGFKMHLDVNDGGISRVLYTVGQREMAFMSILRESISDGMVCVDLGSNIGYTTLPMLSAVGDSGYVYAIEPDPQNLNILKLNINENNFNDRCEIIQCAISDKDGEIDFWQSSQPNLSSVEKHDRSTEKITVPCFSLESFLEDRRYPNFIKMDVEGHEVKIFEGALDYFTKNEGNTNILVEVHPHLYGENNDFEKILQEFFKIGFNAKYAVATPIPQPNLFRAAGYSPVRTVHTDGFHRGIYKDIKNHHLTKFSCYEHWESGSRKIVRSFMIGR